MPKRLETMEQALSRAVRVGMWVSAGATAMMVLILVTDVSMRTSSNRILPGTVELVELLMVATVFMSLAYTSLTDGFVSVELVYSRLSKRLQAILDSFASFFGMLVYALISWQIGIRAWENLWAVNPLETAMLRVPIFPFLFMAALGSALLCLQLLVRFCCLANMLRKEEL